MKIAILTPTFSYFSGIDRVAQLQAEDYAKKGNKVRIAECRPLSKTKHFVVIEKIN